MEIWQGSSLDGAPEAADLVLVFGERKTMTGGLAARFPDAVIVGCSGAGQIRGNEVLDDVVYTAVKFSNAHVATAVEQLEDDDGTETGRRLADALPKEGLRHVMVISEGLHVNGTALADSMQKALPDNVAVTGGLAGDGDRFEETLVIAGNEMAGDQVVAVGFYGDDLEIGFGSLGGWDPFGPQREVTRSEGNVLFELDGKPALELYKQYLGDQAEGLPATGLLFPLFIDDDRGGLVRTILAVDDDAGSLTFAGDVPVGSRAQFMKANFDRLVDGAMEAAKGSNGGLKGNPELAVLVSCVGRRLVLKQRCEDELDAVRDVLGEQATMAGFYSYGEICPLAPGANCQLHNQTMTITTFREA